MLSDVIGCYLDSLEEREFDAPFIALLRALGYWDIHFLHGSFEFGKDFIAKAEVEGVATQFAFQTKAGDINLKAWNVQTLRLIRRSTRLCPERPSSSRRAA
jgi:hypothetical protein